MANCPERYLGRDASWRDLHPLRTRDGLPPGASITIDSQHQNPIALRARLAYALSLDRTCSTKLGVNAKGTTSSEDGVAAQRTGDRSVESSQRSRVVHREPDLQGHLVVLNFSA